MRNRIIEIIEFGHPQSLIQRENSPTSELIKTKLLGKELNKQIQSELNKKECERKGDDRWRFSWKIENIEDNGFSFGDRVRCAPLGDGTIVGFNNTKSQHSNKEELYGYMVQFDKKPEPPYTLGVNPCLVLSNNPFLVKI